jgi:hypothetical protein
MFDNCGHGNRDGLFSRMGFRRNQPECCPPMIGTSMSTSIPLGAGLGCDCHPAGTFTGPPVSAGIPMEGPALPGMPPAMSTLPPGGMLPAPGRMVPGEATPTPAGPSSLRKGI